MSEDIHKYPSQLAERFQVRMPDGLRDKLRAAAEANNRSMNSEIVARLEDSFGSGTMVTPELVETLAWLKTALSEDPRIAKDIADRIYGESQDAD